MSEDSIVSNENEREFALTAAAQAFCNRGVTIACPWEGDLDDREREIFEALVAAIDSYNTIMGRRPTLSDEAVERAAKAIKAIVPFGYGMTDREAVEYARAAVHAAIDPEAEPDQCPICAVAFKLNDLCQTDIELGTCHAECLEGSPLVGLETGDPLPKGSKWPEPYRYSALTAAFSPPPEPAPSSPVPVEAPNAGLIRVRNEMGRFTEFINEDVPTVVRDIHPGVDVLLDLDTRKVVGFRVYDLTDFDAQAEAWCRLAGIAIDALDTIASWDADGFKSYEIVFPIAEFAEKSAAEIRAAYPKKAALPAAPAHREVGE